MGPQGELRLRPPAVENLRRAVQLFTTQHTASKMVPMALRVHASQRREAGSQLLQPPAGEPQGHGVWVKELAPLDRPMVALRGLQLRARDLRCLAEALPGMQTLALRICSFDPAALAKALTPHPKLTHLKLCLGRCTKTPEEVAAALLPLCAHAPALQRITLWCCFVAYRGQWELRGCEEVCGAVRQGLEARGRGGRVVVEAVEELDEGGQDL